MLNRRPLAPNNRQGLMKQFLAELGSEPVYINPEKSIERTSIFHYARPGRQVSEGAFGGGNRIRRG